jgi:hypothetical protein
MTLLSIRVPFELAQALEERRQKTDLNVSAFCRRAIERELARPVFNAEPERRSTSPAPVLIAPQKASE